MLKMSSDTAGVRSIVPTNCPIGALQVRGVISLFPQAWLLRASYEMPPYLDQLLLLLHYEEFDEQRGSGDIRAPVLRKSKILALVMRNSLSSVAGRADERYLNAPPCDRGRYSFSSSSLSLRTSCHQTSLAPSAASTNTPPADFVSSLTAIKSMSDFH